MGNFFSEVNISFWAIFARSILLCLIYKKLNEIGHFVFFQAWMITPMDIFLRYISLKFIFHLFLVSFIPVFVEYFVLYKLNCSWNNSI